VLAAILFDLDGTLVNTDSLHFTLWQQALRDIGMDIDRPFYDRRISGRLNAEIVRDILAHLPFEEALGIAEAKEAKFRQMGQTLQPLAGLLEVLDWTDELGLKRAVVTNAPAENAKFMLEALGLSKAFPIMVLAEDVRAGKPDPAPYQQALAELHITPERAIAFEDSPSGVKSATGAGMETVGIASTHSPDSLAAAGATMVVPDFTPPHLWDWLRSLA
jgi:beta-phosphoglucomutase